MNIIRLATVPHEPEPDPPKAAFSFDMTQPDTNGMVLIDACVPFEMATVFLELLIAYRNATKS